jgi:general secretion pathway protein I
MTRKKKATPGFTQGFTPGFTLLEIMVAVCILSIVLVSVYKLYAQSFGLIYMDQFYSTASLLAQKKMSALILQKKEDGFTETGDFGDSYPGYKWEAAVSRTVSDILGDSGKDLLRIDITVSHEIDKKTYRLQTHHFNQDR